jgi:hypothetical protein
VKTRGSPDGLIIYGQTDDIALGSPRSFKNDEHKSAGSSSTYVIDSSSLQKKNRNESSRSRTSPKSGKDVIMDPSDGKSCRKPTADSRSVTRRSRRIHSTHANADASADSTQTSKSVREPTGHSKSDAASSSPKRDKAPDAGDNVRKVKGEAKMNTEESSSANDRRSAREEKAQAISRHRKKTKHEVRSIHNKSPESNDTQNSTTPSHVAAQSCTQAKKKKRGGSGKRSHQSRSRFKEKVGTTLLADEVPSIQPGSVMTSENGLAASVSEGAPSVLIKQCTENVETSVEQVSDVTDRPSQVQSTNKVLSPPAELQKSDEDQTLSISDMLGEQSTRAEQTNMKPTDDRCVQINDVIHTEKKIAANLTDSTTEKIRVSANETFIEKKGRPILLQL